MPKADASTVARLLREFGQYSALQGGNPYRAKAYGRAADSIGALIVPLDELVKEDRLTEIPDAERARAPTKQGAQAVSRIGHLVTERS